MTLNFLEHKTRNWREHYNQQHDILTNLNFFNTAILAMVCFMSMAVVAIADSDAHLVFAALLLINIVICDFCHHSPVIL